MKTMNGSANGLHNRLNGTAKTPPLVEPSKPLVDGGEGRNAGGKFTAGNRHGRGNPHARKVAALRTAFLNGITEEKLTKMVARLLEIATAGNIPAAKLILAYTIGQPTPAVDPDRLDLDEWKLIDQNPTRSEAIRAFMDGISAAVAIRIVQEALPTLQPTDETELATPDGAGPEMVNNLLKCYLDEQKRRVEKK